MAAKIDMTHQGMEECTVCLQDKQTLGHHQAHVVCQSCLDILLATPPAKCPICRATITHVNGMPVAQPVIQGRKFLIHV